MDLFIKFLLYQSPAIVACIYAALEHFGAIDIITKRKQAIQGLKRLQSGAGYPITFIYNDEEDSAVFNALYKRIKKNIRLKKRISDVLSEGHIPSAIVTAGKPLSIEGLPPEWKQDERTFYSQSHPVLFLFGVKREGEGKGKADKACTIQDIEDGLREEKDSRKFWLGVLVIAILSCVFFFARESIH